MNLHPIFKSLIVLLNEKGVEYLLVGGYAARYYGVQRETRDFDLWVPDHPGNAERIFEVLKQSGDDIPETIVIALSQPNRIVQVRLPPVQIDILEPIIGQRPAVLESFTGKGSLQVEFLTIQSGINFEQAFATRTVGMVDGIPISIVSLEHLKMIKQIGGRPKDLMDLDQLSN